MSASGSLCFDNRSRHAPRDGFPHAESDVHGGRRDVLLAPSLAEVGRRVLDVFVAAVLALVALPLVLACAVAVKLTSRGPAIYRQWRVGRHGRPYVILKIRSMRNDCEALTGPVWAKRRDPRVTPVGCFLRATHLDELPQLVNVLRGEMALVGPRPERPEMVPALARQVSGYERRHAALPGITGLAQIYLPPDQTIDDVRRKLLYDRWYLAHANPWLDTRILLATLLGALTVPFGTTRRILGLPARTTIEVQPRHMPDKVAASLRRTPSASLGPLHSDSGRFDNAEACVGEAAAPRPAFIPRRATASSSASPAAKAVSLGAHCRAPPVE